MSAIAAYVAETRRLGARAADYLRPGRTDAIATLESDLPDLSLPADLRTLWETFDGTSGEGVDLGHLWLDGTFYFFSAEEAVADYRTCEALWATDPGFADYWPKGYLPVATPGDGSRLLVDCVAGSATHGSVYELFHGIGVSRSAASLTRYFETAKAWLDQGALTLADDGAFDINHTQARAIALQLNPDCDSWAQDAGDPQ